MTPPDGALGRVKETGPPTRERMEMLDDESTAAAMTYITKQANKRFLVRMNTTRVHVSAHVRESMRRRSGVPGNRYAEGMIEHGEDAGKLLKTPDDLDIANNTIVVYSTENDPNQFPCRDAATTPFRSEKAPN